MADLTWTDRQHFEILMGARKKYDLSHEPRMTNEHIESLNSKRHAAYFDQPTWQRLDESQLVWKECGICGNFLCVNNWPDRKARTPRFRTFVICGDCDPRHVDDRYITEEKGARVILKRRLRIVQLAQVTRALSIRGCLTLGLTLDRERPCKCAGCAATKLFPPF